MFSVARGVDFPLGLTIGVVKDFSFFFFVVVVVVVIVIVDV